MRRKFLLYIGLLAALGLTEMPSHAADVGNWPNKPIKFVLGYPPGGLTDVLGRLFAQFAAQDLGQPVVVENRPGANGTIAAASVARSARGDSHVLYMGTGGDITLAPTTMKGKLQYDPKKDFVPITEIGRLPSVLVVNADLGIKTMPQLIEYLKAKPNQVSYASYGAASMSRIVAELFQQATKTSITHVPYKGSAAAVSDLMAGHVQIFFDTLASAYPHVQSGKLVAIAVTSEQRLAMAPEVPTMAELGLPSVTYSTWIGLLGPAGMPGEVATRLYDTAKRWSSQPAVRSRIQHMGVSVSVQGPEQMAKFIPAEIDRFAKFAKDANLQFD